MRLINTSTLQMEDFFHDGDRPPYAILSHTWGPDSEEITYQDFIAGRVDKPGIGHFKLRASCDQAQKDGLSYIWIDTCCIDKTNSTELSEAINSMFQWYRDADRCYAYLQDVPWKEGDESGLPVALFLKSRWFLRGWTLQELLAPEILVFFSAEWERLGTKAHLSALVEKATGIPRPFLIGIADITEASVAQRMSWAAKRMTKRREDVAYSLLGLFGVMMPMIYGEGNQAFIRLQEEIVRRSSDDSILAWGVDAPKPQRTGVDGSNADSAGEDDDDGEETVSSPRGVLAARPADFVNCGLVVSSERSTSSIQSFNAVGGSLRIRLPLHTAASGQIYGVLGCHLSHDPARVIGVPLCAIGGSVSQSHDVYIRPQNIPAAILENYTGGAEPIVVHIRKERRPRQSSAVSRRRHAFFIEDHSEPGLDVVDVKPAARWLKEKSMVASTIDPQTQGVQRTWIRLRPRSKDQTEDLVVLLELEARDSSPLQARCHLMLSDTWPDGAGPPDDLDSLDVTRGIFGKRSATLDPFNYHVDVKNERVGAHTMFVVRFTTVTGAPAVPTASWDTELRVSKLKSRITETIMREDLIVTERIQSGLQSDALRETVGPLQARWTEIEKQIQDLQAELFRTETQLEEAERECSALDAKRESLALESSEISEQRKRLQTRLDQLVDSQHEVSHGHDYGTQWRDEMIPLLLKELEPVEGEVTAVKPPTDVDRLSIRAVCHGRAGILQYLLEEANVDARSTNQVTGQSLLSTAALEGRAAAVHVLLDHGSDAQMSDSFGLHPLHRAAMYGEEAVTRLLLSRSADLNARGDLERTPLAVAARYGQDSIVQLLFAADIEAKDKNGQTPLYLAARHGHHSTVTLLLDQGAQVDAADREGLTPLAVAAKRGHSHVVEILLKRGANIEATAAGGLTPLYVAAAWGQESTVRTLVYMGAFCEARIEEGWTPLAGAAAYGHIAVVLALLDGGADLESKSDDNETPLFAAAQEGRENVIRALLERGALVDAKDNEGQTAMIVAAKHGHAGAVQALREHGADTSIRDNEGLTALYAALKNNQEAVVGLLLNVEGGQDGSRDIRESMAQRQASSTQQAAVAVEGRA